MKRWLNELTNSWSWHGLLITALIFVATFAVSLAIVSFILVKLPPDYFSKSSERNFLEGHPKWVRIAAAIGKNALGIVLVLVGIVLSIPGVPGQGILTILLGIMLLDFPGKRRLEHKIISRPKVREAIDKLRHRFGKPPLQLD
jgi:hypothetical protein